MILSNIIIRLIRFLGKIPLGITHKIGHFIGVIFFYIPNKTSYIVKRNIDLCFPKLSTHEKKILVKKSLCEMGKTYSEIGYLWQLKQQQISPLIINPEDIEQIKQLKKYNKGIIFAIPHLGSWELAGLYGALHFTLNILYRPPRLTALDNFIKRARSKLNSKLVSTKNKFAIRNLIKAINIGEAIALLPDQEPKSGNGIFVNFFGISALTMTLIARIAKKTQAPVVFAYAKRLQNNEFKLFYSAPFCITEQCGLTSATKLVNEKIEELVNACPEQYQWNYKRFSKRPMQEKSLY